MGPSTGTSFGWFTAVGFAVRTRDCSPFDLAHVKFLDATVRVRVDRRTNGMSETGAWSGVGCGLSTVTRSVCSVSTASPLLLASGCSGSARGLSVRVPDADVASGWLFTLEVDLVAVELVVLVVSSRATGTLALALFRNSVL